MIFNSIQIDNCFTKINEMHAICVVSYYVSPNAYVRVRSINFHPFSRTTRQMQYTCWPFDHSYTIYVCV